MCEFCAQHGEGKKWYLNAKNYAEDLLSDARRRKFLADAASIPTEKLEKTFDEFDTKMDHLNQMPGFVRRVLRWRATDTMKKNHYGQVVPIEDVERIFDFVTSITRFACVCRRGALRSEQRYCYGVGIGPQGGQWEHLTRQNANYLGGPDSVGLEKLTKEEALAAFRDHERESLCHTVWTFVTPFIGGICNCDRADCAAMRSTVTHNMPIFFRAEYVAEVNPEQCNGCRACMRACQFGAIGYSAALKKAFVNPRQCYGCGICRAHCSKNAIMLRDRSKVAVAARLW